MLCKAHGGSPHGPHRDIGQDPLRQRLSFSWRLMAYPEAAIDYVVVHELAHIRYKDHSRAFYGFIESVLPDYRDRIKLLKGTQEA